MDMKYVEAQGPSDPQNEPRSVHCSYVSVPNLMLVSRWHPFKIIKAGYVVFDYAIHSI
jgi:hypothetical protein